MGFEPLSNGLLSWTEPHMPKMRTRWVIPSSIGHCPHHLIAI
jgi:hypothetical protein